MAGEPSDAEIQSAMTDILREGELSKLTSRIVRTQLEEKFSVSFLGRKKEIDKMLMKMIENQERLTEEEKEQENGNDEMNGVEPEEDDQEDDSPSEDDEPSPKKIKQESSKTNSVAEKESVELNDAELARQLHENEKGLRTRRQRTKKTVERKKPATAKKAKESKGENKGFGKLMMLSPVLAELVGQDRMSRGDVVKKMWEIIRERKLEDPKNKRFTICDEQLQKVFGVKKLKTFSMMKYLKRHIKDPELIA